MSKKVTKVEIFICGPSDTRELRRELVEMIERDLREHHKDLMVEAFTWNAPTSGVYVTDEDDTQERIHNHCDPSSCDILIGCFNHRIGKHPYRRDGREFPSISAYEVISAIEARRAKSLPEVILMRPEEPYIPPAPPEDDDGETWQTYRAKCNEGRTQSEMLTRFLTEFSPKATSSNKYKDHENAKAIVRSFLQDCLARLGTPQTVPPPIPFPTFPFRGLRELGVADHDIFFGRADDVRIMRERIAADARFLCIVGPSGTGKSSLLKAGVIGSLVKDQPSLWSYLEFSPRTPASAKDPLDAFADALLAQGAQSGYLTGALLERAEIAAELLRLFPGTDAFNLEAAPGGMARLVESSLHRKSPATRLILAVNQLEEIFEWQPLEQRRFMQLLVASASVPRLLALATLRDDKQSLLSQFTEMRSLLSQQDNKFLPVSAPAVEQLVDMIQKPLSVAKRIADISIEEHLVGKIVADAAAWREASGNALPLVAYCLESLRRNCGQTLTRAAYDQMGGIAGAVKTHAEASTRDASETDLRKLFRRLVTSHGGAPVAVDAPRSVLLRDGTDGELVERLIEAKLLQASSTTEGQPAVRLTHEILFTAWPALRDWIDRERHLLALQDEVANDAQLWRQRKGRRFIKLRGAVLDEVLEIMRVDPYLFGARQYIKDYIEAAQELREKERLITAINSGLFQEMRKSLANGARLEPIDRGEDLGQVRPQFWAAVTGDDRPNLENSRTGSGNEGSIYDQNPQLANATITGGSSVLHLAALCGQRELVKNLVQRFGANVNRLNDRGLGVLASAAYGGHVEICRYLVEECGVDPAAGEKLGMSAALFAQQLGHRQVLDYLITKGASLDVNADGGWNRLTELVRAGDLAGVRGLVAEGQSLAYETDAGVTLVMIACGEGNLPMITYLAAELGRKVQARDKQGQTALHYLPFAIDVGVEERYQIISLLASHGLDIDEQDNYGRTALADACARGKRGDVAALLRASAAVEIADVDGMSPLFLATYEGDDHIFELLLEAGADPTREANQGWVALHQAASAGNSLLVERIARIPNHDVATSALSRGSLDRPTHSGHTALMLAAGAGHAAVISTLLKAGATRTLTLSLRSGGNADALSFAITGQHVDAVRALLERELNGERGRGDDRYPYPSHLAFAVSTSSPAVIEVLLDSGADPNGHDPAGDSPLHDAAAAGRADVVDLLLKRGARAAVLDSRGRTAAEVADTAGHTALARELASRAGFEPAAWRRPRISDELRSLSFTPASAELAGWVNKRLQGFSEWIKIPTERRSLRVARLPFLDNASLLAIEDTGRRGRREQFAAIREMRDLTPMDWTSAPIHRMNERWGAVLDEKTTAEYCRFFCAFMKADDGRFQIVERVDDLPWTETATAEDRASVAEKLRPLQVIDGPTDGKVTMHANIIYGNALFSATLAVRVAPQKTIKDGKEYNAVLGEMAMTEDEPLAENLPVFVDSDKSPFG